MILEPLLAPADCARCKGCCIFPVDGTNEAPVFDNETKNLVLEQINPTAQFVRDGIVFQITPTPIPHSDDFICPVLDPDRGCRLGDRKPLECALWPFYVLRKRGQLVIALSPTCTVVRPDQLTQINEALDNGLEERLIRRALESPREIFFYEDWMILLRSCGGYRTVKKRYGSLKRRKGALHVFDN